MDLPSCQKHNPATYREIVTKLLKWDKSYDAPNKDYLEVAQYLLSCGFINLREYYFIICANDSDKSDLPYVVNPYCNNRLEIASDYDEDYDNPIMCDLCERDIFPDTYKKKRYYSLAVTINHLKVMEWFEKQLASLNITWSKVKIGVYYILVEKNFVNLIVPECCSDKSYFAVDKLRTNPTALITFNKESLNPPLDLYIVPIADLMCKCKTLNEVLHETIEKGVPELLPNVSFQALNCYSYIPLRKTTLPEKKILRLKIIDNIIYVNDVEVISKQATSSIRIFRVLLKQFLRDFEAAEEYKFLSVIQIADSLGIEDPEQQVRRPLNRMQQAIAEKLASTLGVNIERDDVIQACNWSGYRLNPSTINLSAN